VARHASEQRLLTTLNPDPIMNLYSYNNMLILAESLCKHWNFSRFKPIAQRR